MNLKWIFLFTCLQVSFLIVQAQKKPVTNETPNNWESLGSYKISNDGKYVWYNYNSSSGSILVLSSTDGSYKKQFPGIFDASFTEDSRYLIFNSAKGLAILKPRMEEPQYIPGASEYSMPKAGDGQWLAYKLKGDLYIRDLSSGKEKTYAGVTQYWFNEQGTALLLQTKTAVEWVNLADGRQKTICRGSHAVNVAFDGSGTQLAYTAQKGEPLNILQARAAKKAGKKPAEISLCYFEKSMDSALVKVTNHSRGIRSGFIVSAETPSFSSDGKQLFFKLDQYQQPAAYADSSVITDKLDVWHYKDSVLMSQQLSEHHYTPNYAAVVQPGEAGNLTQLENADTVLAGRPGNKYALACLSTGGLKNEIEFWQQRVPGYTLVSLDDPTRKIILQKPRAFSDVSISPAEHFVCWFDTLSKQYLVYDIAAKSNRNISGATHAILNRRLESDLSGQYGIAGWLANDEAVLVYDQYDIWQLDPKGKKPPINITAGYGSLHHIVFRLAADGNSLPSLRSGDPILLAALDDKKYNGFCKIKTGASAVPEITDLQPRLFYFPNIFSGAPPNPLKAKNAEVYLMQRQSAIDAPNLVVTKNLTAFTPLSDIHPQRGYNWMTSELHHWKMNDGRMGTGILYKPEDFDLRKKYPVIFHYYQERSNEICQFKTPGLSDGQLNIAWYISNGYLVFIPDITQPTDRPAEAILNAVESAARYLATFRYVDAAKMGLQGHSFGGYETNVIIAHCNLFAAAQSSSGVSDLVSYYGGVGFGERSLNFLLEEGEFNLGAGKTPWQDADLYRRSSPIFFVDKIKTPLLIMHNKNDGAVPFAQSVELFTALRRLQKPVWMLQYDGEGHLIGEFENQRDFTIRQQQFFDHYLKGKPAPKWMTEGIPAKNKGLQSGLQLDTAGKLP